MKTGSAMTSRNSGADHGSPTQVALRSPEVTNQQPDPSPASRRATRLLATQNGHLAWDASGPMPSSSVG